MLLSIQYTLLQHQLRNNFKFVYDMKKLIGYIGIFIILILVAGSCKIKEPIANTKSLSWYLDRDLRVIKTDPRIYLNNSYFSNSGGSLQWSGTVALPAATSIGTVSIDNATDPTSVKFYSGATQLNPDVPAAFRVDASNYVGFTLTFDPAWRDVPVDNTIYYYGAFPSQPPGTSAQSYQVIIPFNCTLIGYSLTTKSSAACSAETGTLSVRVNNTTDILLSNAITWGVGGAWNLNFFSSALLNTNISAGDEIEMKLLTPTWATDATEMLLSTTLYFKNR